MKICCRLSLVLLSILISSSASSLLAIDGNPFAVRRWPGGALSFESDWGLRLAWDPSGRAAHTIAIKADHTITPGDDIDHYLFRPANATSSEWVAAAEMRQQDDNAIRVSTVHWAGRPNPLWIEIDGARILLVSAAWFQARDSTLPIDLSHVRVARPHLLILAAGKQAIVGTAAESLISTLQPAAVLLSGLSPAERTPAAELCDQIGSNTRLEVLKHNTFAGSSSLAGPPVRLVVMSDSPWKMPAELAGLFAAMETANERSQNVFAALSIRQLNFKPSNGTHTPRWNCEHMMGRQLLFFSQIYHALDPTIPVMDLNPSQMPPDYRFKHPDWTGREEALQMRRVSEFSRRFAYLLDGIDLDNRAPGSRWSLRGLLGQMQRHYGEHTENTIKKFDLPDYPRE